MKSLSKRLYHDLNDLHEMVLDINKKKQQTGEQKWRFLSQKWGTTISRMVPIQSDLATHKKWRAANMGCFTSPGYRFWSSYWVQPENLTWTNMMTLNIFELQHWTHIYIYVPTRVVGASCFLFSDFFSPCLSMLTVMTELGVPGGSMTVRKKSRWYLGAKSSWGKGSWLVSMIWILWC